MGHQRDMIYEYALYAALKQLCVVLCPTGARMHPQQELTAYPPLTNCAQISSLVHNSKQPRGLLHGLEFSECSDLRRESAIEVVV